MSLVAIPANADVTWMEQGVCRKYDPDLWHPKFDAPSSTAAAKAICKLCPVQSECLDWALKYDENGVWGGTSEADRRTLQRRKSHTACIVCDGEDILITEGTEVCLGCGASWRI